MLAKGQLAGNERGFNRWKLRRTEILFAQELKHWPGCDSSHETALLIQPFALRTWSLCGTVTNKGRTRSTKSDQFMRVYGQVIPS